MDLFRWFLLAGLIGHKLFWEILKRRAGAKNRQGSGANSPRLRLVKGAKIGILMGLMVQTLLPDILPILSQPTALRWLGAGMFALGLTLAVVGRLQLGENWSDIEAAQVKSSQILISNGIYGYIRHPIYAGDVALVLGQQLCLNSWLVVPMLAGSVMMLRQAIHEEKLLLQSLPGYDEYCKRTRRFVPFVF